MERKLRNLKAEVEVTVELNRASIARAKQHLNQALGSVKVDAEVDRTSIRNMSREMKNLGLKTNLDAEINRERLQRVADEAVNGIRSPKVKVEVDVDRGAISRVVVALSSMITATSGVTRGLAVAAEASVNFLGALGGLGGAIGRLIPTFTTFGGNLVSLAISAQVLIVAMGALGAVGGMLVGVFMAIGGAIGAAFATAPALLSALLIPIGAIALGMDGIKRAMEPINDELELMKTSVSTVFEQGLRPVFEELQVVMPAVQAGMMGVSAALVQMAENLVPILTSPAAIELIGTAFAGVNEIIVAMIGPMQNLVRELLNIAGTSELYRIMGDLLASVTNRFAEFLAEAQRSEILIPLFRNLSLVLDEATGWFIALMEAGMQFLNAAAPGLEAFFAGLTAAFKSIDWAYLGESFGRIFAAIGEGMERVPPETWQRLADATAEFATVIEGLIASGALTGLIQFFADAISWMTTMIDWIARLIGAFRALAGFLTRDTETMKEGWTLMTEGIKGQADDLAATLPGKMGTASEGAKTGFLGPLAPLPNEAGAIMTGTVASMQGSLIPLPLMAGHAGTQTSDSLLAPLRPLPGVVAPIGQNTSTGFINPIMAGAPLAGDAGRRNADEAVRGFESGEPGARAAGDAMGSGILSALSSWAGALLAKATSMVTDAWNAAMSAIGAHSPSRLFGETGRAMVEGIIVGLQVMAPHLYARIISILRQAHERARAFVREHADQVYPVNYGQIPQAAWDRLLAMGYRGDPNDRAERLYVTGRDLAVALAGGIRAGTPQVEAAWSNLGNIQRDTVQQWIRDLESQRPALVDAIRRLADLIRRGMEAGWTPEQWREEFLAERDRWRLRHQRGGMSTTVYRVEPMTREAPTASEIAEAMAGTEFVIDSRGGEVIARWVRRENSLAEARI